MKVSFISTTCDITQAKNICKIFTLNFYLLKTLQLCECVWHSRDTDERNNFITTVKIKFNNNFAITHVRYFRFKTATDKSS